jgi:hypothetical protein
MPVMIEEITTSRLERMVGSNLCLNLCFKNLSKQKNMPVLHRKGVSMKRNYILTPTITNKAEFELPVGMTSM